MNRRELFKGMAALALAPGLSGLMPKRGYTFEPNQFLPTGGWAQDLWPGIQKWYLREYMLARELSGVTSLHYGSNRPSIDG